MSTSRCSLADSPLVIYLSEHDSENISGSEKAITVNSLETMATKFSYFIPIPCCVPLVLYLLYQLALLVPWRHDYWQMNYWFVLNLNQWHNQQLPKQVFDWFQCDSQERQAQQQYVARGICLLNLWVYYFWIISMFLRRLSLFYFLYMVLLLYFFFL